MQKKAQFKNGYTFNRVINGCWQLSAEHCLQGHLDYDDAIRAFHELVEQGFTTFDCADIYTGAEEVLGRFVTELKASGHYQEEDIQIHTKFVPDKDVLPVINMEYTEGIVDRSLKRMHREALDLVQIKNLKDRKPNELSGGQQQRVALARAFVIEPGVLLMDEPLSNLDAKLRVQMRTAIKKLQRRLGITTIYVTHDQEEALAISDRIAVMKEGNIMQVGTPEAIYKKPENTFVAGFIGVSNFVDCEVKGDNPEAAVLDIKGECKITCQLKKPFSGKGIISARPEQLFFDEKEGLPGKIIMSTFLGDFIEYEIELDNGQTLQLNEYTKDVQTVRPDGQNVKVNFDIHAVGVYDAATQEVISW